MLTRSRLCLLLAAGAFFTMQCGLAPKTPTPSANLPNPASVFCEQQGNRLEIITAEDGSQSGDCVFPDGSRCDEWAFFRGECPSVASPTPPPPNPAATAVPAADSLTEDWVSYTVAGYGFSLRLPQDWIAEPAPESDPLLGGHLLTIHPAGQTTGINLRVTFRRQGEETLLWPTGVGQGEFEPGGTLQVAGGDAMVMRLRCPSGEITSMWFHGGPADANIRREDLEFGFLLSASATHCEPGKTLEGDVAETGMLIVQSLTIE